MDIPPSEWAASRLAWALARRLQAVPHHLAWAAATYDNGELKSRVQAFKDLHREERCFILGNGPSLALTELEPLAEGITIGLHRVFVNFNRMGCQPDYYVAIDELVAR